jgi:PST family polysaccharide transporter
MALVSAFLLPLVAILVRDHVRLTVSDEAAGWWEAMVRIASYYMMFITSLISLYVLPRLSANDTASNYRATIASFYKTMLPIVVLGMIVVYLLRDFLIAFLFSAEFEPVSALFKWQLVGDFIKVVTTVLAFRFIAVNDLKRYLLAEFISVLCFYLAAHVLITSYGVEGVVMAHVITYAVYLATLLVMLRKELWG